MIEEPQPRKNRKTKPTPSKFIRRIDDKVVVKLPDGLELSPGGRVRFVSFVANYLAFSTGQPTVWNDPILPLERWKFGGSFPVKDIDVRSVNLLLGRLLRCAGVLQPETAARRQDRETAL